MKVLFAVCALLVVINAEWAPKLGDDLAQIRTDCIKEENVTDQLLEALKKFEYPDEPSVRCYMRCIAKKLDVFVEGTGLDADRVTEQIRLERTKEEVQPGVVECIAANEDKSDECAWIYRDFKCMIDRGLLKTEALVNV